MRRMLTLIGCAVVMMLALVAPTTSASAATTSATRHGNVYSFALLTPNTAFVPSGAATGTPGDRITVTGGGTFNPATGTVHARGTFVHRNADGTVHCRGLWTATKLTGWTDFSAARSRPHGGIVSMLVTHYCTTTGEIHTDIPMTVTSTRDAPAGSSYVEGVTVAEFTQSSAGTVAIRFCRLHPDGGGSALIGRESHFCVAAAH